VGQKDGTGDRRHVADPSAAGPGAGGGSCSTGQATLSDISATFVEAEVPTLLRIWPVVFPPDKVQSVIGWRDLSN
jgi:hypothetical protein